MRLHKILTEMSWPDKFYELEQKIRSLNMTVDEFMDFMYDEFKIYVHPIGDPAGPAMSMSGASITATRISAKDLDSNTNPGVFNTLVGSKVLNLHFGVGVDGDTPVKEISGFFQVLRHELTHSQQGDKIQSDKLKRFQTGYVSPDPKDPVSEDSILYTIQIMERSAQSVDLAYYLVKIGFTPEQFEQCLHLVLGDVANMQKPIPTETLLTITKERMSQVGRFDQDKIDNLITNEMAEMALAMVQTLISQIVGLRVNIFPNISKNYRQQLRQIQHAYIKLAKKRYPKVKGYYLRHKDEDIESYKAHDEFRAQMNILNIIDQLMGARGVA